jgi:hypothetical protein
METLSKAKRVVTFVSSKKSAPLAIEMSRSEEKSAFIIGIDWPSNRLGGSASVGNRDYETSGLSFQEGTTEFSGPSIFS